MYRQTTVLTVRTVWTSNFTLYVGAFGLQALDWAMNQCSSCRQVFVNLYEEVSWQNVKLIPGITADCGHMQYWYSGSVGSGHCRLPVEAVDKHSIYPICRTDMQCWLLLASVRETCMCYWIILTRCRIFCSSSHL